MTVEFPPFKTMVNEPFAGLAKNKDRIIILWGGRGSGKSVAALRLMIFRCLTEPYFKCILIRKVYDTIRESMFEALRDEIEIMGLTELFDFTVSPMEIKCKNGNKFICRGLDNPGKLKSIKEPSCAWYEEGNQITEEDFITVSTSIRSNKARFLQEIFSFNPETHGEGYEDFWIYKRFFSNQTTKTFRTVIEILNPVTKEMVEYAYTSIWSSYRDNPHLPPETIAMYEDLKNTNPHYYTVFTMGQWGNRDVSNQFYKGFTMDNVDVIGYNPNTPLHISFDENVNPYLTLTIHQVEQEGDNITINQIDEICLVHPRNTLADTCNEFKAKYKYHHEGLFIYGDRTSKKADAKLEKGQNFFTLAVKQLEQYRPTLRLPNVNPNVKSRGDFINDVFRGKYPGKKIVIGDNCTNSVQDYINVVEAADGNKSKPKVKAEKNGPSFERFGHTSDANDYLYIEVFKSLYLNFIKGGVNMYAKLKPRAKVFNKYRM